ncbi:MAG TPA: AraC family transcriptional regulator [Verrucomicrobiae bacterium]
MKRTAKSQPIQTAAPEFFSPDVSEARRFYLDLTPPAKTRLAVVCGGCEHCTPDYAIHRTTFPFYSIEYVARGRGTVKLQGRSHALQPGRAFAYGPGVRQDIAGAPDTPLVKYFVDFAGWAAAELLRSCGLPPGRVVQVHPPHALQNLFDELIACGLRGTRSSAVLCGKLLECLALKLADARAPTSGAEALSFSTYEQCQRHLQQHFRRLRTLEQVAEECHVNAAYLCRLFRRYSHQSPYQQLLRLKMNFAAHLLQQPGALVKNVAEHAGFADPFHFSRAFKSVLGLSPDAFRRLR